MKQIKSARTALSRYPSEPDVREDYPHEGTISVQAEKRTETFKTIETIRELINGCFTQVEYLKGKLAPVLTQNETDTGGVPEESVESSETQLIKELNLLRIELSDLHRDLDRLGNKIYL